jgi:hypothetical protein
LEFTSPEMFQTIASTEPNRPYQTNLQSLDIGKLPAKATPAAAEPLVKDSDGNPMDGSFSYSSVIGMLQYLQNHSRPDISFVVSQCSRFVHSSKWSHEDALKQIGQYLKGTINKGLFFQPTGIF